MTKPADPPLAPNARAAHGGNKKRHAKYLSHPSKRKKGLNLSSGIQGFFLTCDGGREHQSSREAINLLDQYYEKLLKGKGSAISGLNDSGSNHNSLASSVVRPDSFDNAPTTSSEPPDEEHEENSHDSGSDSEDEAHDSEEPASPRNLAKEEEKNGDNDRAEKSGDINLVNSIDGLLEAEIAGLRDQKKAHFTSLETGCNGVLFIRMLKKNEDLRPVDLVEAIMHSVVASKKPLTRFCLRLLPMEITCYASVDEIRKAAEPVILRYFPADQAKLGLKFAVVYEARANTGLDRMEIINAVAKLVPKPHFVDLTKPDKTIIVEVIKKICAIGVVSNFKEYAKYNLRQLASPKQQP